MFDFDKLAADWVRDGFLPGGVLNIAAPGGFRFSKSYGAYSNNESVQPIEQATLFDLASLTKVVATLPVVLSLAQEGSLGLDDPVGSHVEEFRHPEVTIRHLLQHTSGLPADLAPVPRDASGTDVLRSVWEAPLTSEPGSRATYSDLGMIALGILAERAGGEPLDRAARRRIFAPLGMNNTGFATQLEGLPARAAATEKLGSSFLVGQVHDEKSFALGGVSGSAGLFSTAADLSTYLQYWLHPSPKGPLSPEWVAECFRDPFGGRGLGWELLHDADLVPPSCGTNWSAGSFGHTGFTGTSLWVDPKAQLSVVWLTNAVHYGRQTPIRALRRKLHDQIRADLLGD
ncbi:serine hydrolase domain-containing protein [Cohnella fermenti]|uniref:Beta-lactamase family protein n=1 Tax=Cohnella fermenti TaxID=2565925 RepID=A0A4S4BL25_9BACL|nr:serine hydrolase domain-containing protein [Cohnella fermenti]THF74503.1 beta-lactamase family protein [Cohnella fermenti]